MRPSRNLHEHVDVLSRRTSDAWHVSTPIYNTADIGRAAARA